MFHLTCVANYFGVSAKRLMSAAVKPSIVFVLGGPGAGKGTQCEKIVNEFGYVHLSAGDLLRAERASGSEDGDLIESCIREGKIVPVEITISLIEKAMNKNSVKKFIIDGFPRNEDNLSGFNKRMKGKADVKCVIFFDCPEDECIRRILERGKASGRSDDNMESLKKRFKTYYNDTMPIIQHYETKGLVKKVEALRTPEEGLSVFKEYLQYGDLSVV